MAFNVVRRIKYINNNKNNIYIVEMFCLLVFSLERVKGHKMIHTAHGRDRYCDTKERRGPCAVCTITAHTLAHSPLVCLIVPLHQRCSSSIKVRLHKPGLKFCKEINSILSSLELETIISEGKRQKKTLPLPLPSYM